MQIPNLRELRELHGLTQKELADTSGVSLRSVAGYEGGAQVRPNTARKLAQALNVEVADLVGVESYPKAEAPPSPEQPNFNGLLEEERRGGASRLLDGLIAHVAETAERWSRETETGGMFRSEDSAVAFTIEVNIEAARLYGLAAEHLKPAIEELLPAASERSHAGRSLAEALERLEAAIVAVNAAADAVVPPFEFSDAELAEAVEGYEREWEKLSELEQRRETSEVEKVLKACEERSARKAAELRGRIA